MKTEKAVARDKIAVEDLIKEIEEQAGVDASKISMLGRYTWFDGPDGRPTLFRHGKESPIDKGYTIFGQFMIDDKVRIYLLWTATGNGGDDSPHPPMMYQLEPTVKTYGCFSMPLSVWQKKMASDLVTASETAPTGPEEREAILDLCEAFAAEKEEKGETVVALAIRELAEAIEEEEHLDPGDDVEDDGEPVEGEEGATPSAAPQAEAPAAS